MNDDATVSNETEGAETFKHFMFWKIRYLCVQIMLFTNATVQWRHLNKVTHFHLCKVRIIH